MNGKLRQLRGTALLVSSLLLGGPAPGEAGHEEVGVYEDWRTDDIVRADRWTGRVGLKSCERSRATSS